MTKLKIIMEKPTMAKFKIVKLTNVWIFMVKLKMVELTMSQINMAKWINE